ncbi:MAG: diguanylate cyclase [Deltaproteobacteria bacterium]|nr:diguanylate cyclase [Deltaproteobacteria bacterium]
MGEDEFAVLAIDMAEENADIQMARLQEQIERRNSQADRRYSLSISVGCSRYDPGNPRSIDELMVQADERMYGQKRSKIS